MRIKVLGAHNSESKQTSSMCLLVDDILALDAGGLTSNLSFDEQMKIKAVLLTHHHYDHIRDIPTFSMNRYMRKNPFYIFTHQTVVDKLKQYLLNNDIYIEFHKRPEEDPTIKFNILSPYVTTTFEGYSFLAIPLPHSIPAMGYQITSPDGKTIFYSGDTGNNLAEVWDKINPQLLFIEVTTSNKWVGFVRNGGHLTPGLLEEELKSFRKVRGYLPEVVAIHINPTDEDEIKKELSEVSSSLGIPIRTAYEGMQIEI